MTEDMNDRDFMRSIETTLERGMESVPLPALEPVGARYRDARPIVRHGATRATLAVAAVGLALLTSVGAAAAAENESPVTIVSTAVRSIEVELEQILSPGPAAEPVRTITHGDSNGSSGGEGNAQPGSTPVIVPLPSPEQPASGPAATPSDVPALSPSGNPTPAPSTEPTPIASDSPTPDPGSSPPATGQDTGSANPAPVPSPAATPDPPTSQNSGPS
jgi:hypothetical protein